MDGIKKRASVTCGLYWRVKRPNSIIWRRLQVHRTAWYTLTWCILLVDKEWAEVRSAYSLEGRRKRAAIFEGC